MSSVARHPIEQSICGKGYGGYERIARIQHGPFGRRTLLWREQQSLGSRVFCHRAMKVQVVLSEIGENGGVEVKPMHAPQRQPVRGNLGDQMRPAKALQLRGQSHRSEERRVGKECRSRW